MRNICIPTLIGLSLTTTAVWGNCDDATKLTGTDLENTVSGQTVCVAGGTQDSWQEEHRFNGELWDYKGGPDHPVDPTEKVGTWQFDRDEAGIAQGVTYLYKDGSSYTFTIHESGGQYTFCQGGTAVVTGASFQGSPDCGFSASP